MGDASCGRNSPSKMLPYIAPDRLTYQPTTISPVSSLRVYRSLREGGRMSEVDEQMIELTIEALTGTVYDLCVSPFETILGIKMKIQRLEGHCSFH